MVTNRTCCNVRLCIHNLRREQQSRSLFCNKRRRTFCQTRFGSYKTAFDKNSYIAVRFSFSKPALLIRSSYSVILITFQSNFHGARVDSAMEFEPLAVIIRASPRSVTRRRNFSGNKDGSFRSRKRGVCKNDRRILFINDTPIKKERKRESQTFERRLRDEETVARGIGERNK